MQGEKKYRGYAVCTEDEEGKKKNLLSGKGGNAHIVSTNRQAVREPDSTFPDL